MTAIGFVLAVLGAFIHEAAWTSGGKENGAYVFVVGAGLFIIGVTIKLWEIMP